jgi:hypothetical protein
MFAEGTVIIVSLTSMDVVPDSLSGAGQATSAATSQMSEKCTYTLGPINFVVEYAHTLNV